MDKKKYRVFGELILVEKIMVKENVMDKTGVFKNRVKVIAIGEGLTETPVKVDDVLVVGGIMERDGEVYIAESQILRWEL
jgi:hypothetical protein|nr:MAG TPA: co-chaperonin [Caudoviricetes sp.]